jgi:hydroxyethylthiazole kinase
MPAEESEMDRPWAPLETPTDLPDRTTVLLKRLRAEPCRVHAITNAAAQVFTANLLLAAGATPSLTVAADEVEAFASACDGLLINLGTLDAERRASIPVAIAAARRHGKPWILDPVFVDASPLRLDIARQCVAACPAFVRCNIPEFVALAGTDATPGSINAFARAHRLIVALTGEVDFITDGHRSVTSRNGHHLMGRVTAMGCAATALIAAFAALEVDPLDAAAGAILVVGIAGEIAAERSQGPGTFQAAFLDALYGLDSGTDISTRAKVS